MPISPRYPLVISAFSPALGSLATENISQSGVAFRVLEPSPPSRQPNVEGESIDLELKLDGNGAGFGRVISLRAKVVWQREDCFGVHFVSLTHQDRMLIEAMIGQYAALCRAMVAWHSAA